LGLFSGQQIERLDWLPRTCSKGSMRAPIVPQIRTWRLAVMEWLWSQLAPRRAASETVAVNAARSRRELVLENAVLRHQVNVLRRRGERPKLRAIDRLKLSSSATATKYHRWRSSSSGRSSAWVISISYAWI
jgi:hypothetical protein